MATESKTAGQRAEEMGHTVLDKVKGFFHRVYKIITSHFGLVIILMCYSFAGAAIFQMIEGPHETKEKHDIIEMRAHIMKQIHNHTTAVGDNMDDESFLEMVEKELKAYENQLHTAFLHGINSDSEAIVWDFWGSLFFCATVYTTIGYGHIAPATGAGRVATMIYGLIGIPLCLVVLADLGKLFTRCIKFLWAFIRRFYYTGTCKRVRQTKTVKALGQKIDSIGDKLNDKLGSIGDKLDELNPLSNDDKDEGFKEENGRGKPEVAGMIAEEEDFESVPIMGVDDEFNLPPIVAITITVVYIFSGAIMYTQWESWSYLEAFYFVFVSISTIGFGDVLPDHPKKFLASFVYLLVGLSLVAMVINVIMVVVHSTIDKAKEKVFEVSRKTMGINLDPNADSDSESSDKERERDKKTE